MRLRVTTISENTAARSDLLAEWGLSILVETDELNVLFDTGQSLSASYNADIIGIDLGKIDKIVLSHGHFDHTGGLRQILRKISRQVEIIAHPDVWAPKYKRSQDGTDKYIGIPFRRQELESLGGTFNLAAESVRITDKIMTTGEIPMITKFEDIDAGMLVKGDTGWQSDRLLDDQALIIRTELGLIVILGCAHHGIINTLYHAQQLTGVKPIHTVLGGCHLYTASEERVRLTIAALKKLGVQKLGVSHCTGFPAAVRLASEFGNNFFFNNTGTTLNL